MGRLIAVGGILLKKMSSQEEETYYQNQIGQDKFDRQ